MSSWWIKRARDSKTQQDSKCMALHDGGQHPQACWGDVRRMSGAVDDGFAFGPGSKRLVSTGRDATVRRCGTEARTHQRQWHESLQMLATWNPTVLNSLVPHQGKWNEMNCQGKAYETMFFSNVSMLTSLPCAFSTRYMRKSLPASCITGVASLRIRWDCHISAARHLISELPFPGSDNRSKLSHSHAALCYAKSREPCPLSPVRHHPKTSVEQRTHDENVQAWMVPIVTRRKAHVLCNCMEEGLSGIAKPEICLFEHNLWWLAKSNT